MTTPTTPPPPPPPTDTPPSRQTPEERRERIRAAIGNYLERHAGKPERPRRRRWTRRAAP